MTKSLRAALMVLIAAALAFSSACTPAQYEMWKRMMNAKPPAPAVTCLHSSPLEVFVNDPGNTAQEWAWAVDTMTKVRAGHPGLFDICGGQVPIRFVNDPGNWNAQTDGHSISVNSRKNANGSPVGMEETLVHEITHVWDYRNLRDSGRDRVMSLLAGCSASTDGVCTSPVTPTWWTGASYPYHSCEVFAEVYALHVWYGNDTMRMWGVYSWGDDLLPTLTDLIER